MMTHEEAGRYWNGNAEAWTVLSRAGYDVYRDYLNTPAFLKALPGIDGLKGIDIGCGEGANTRLLAKSGAKMTAVDISEVFVRFAQATEEADPLGISYRIASAVELPFAPDSFDFATAFMSFMDIPETELALAETFRILKPGGFLQFSISHPCFTTPHRRNLRDANSQTYAIEVGDYFKNMDGELEEWLFGAAPEELKRKFPKFKVPRFTLTLSQWVNLLVETGFAIEYMQEPAPDEETVKNHPYLQDAQVVAYFLHIRCRKPHAGGK